MAKLPFLKLIAFCLFSVPSITARFTTLHTIQSSDLFSRDSTTCAGLSGYTSCGQGLPSDFCCSSGDTCIAFNDGASAICCPQGSACTSITPIPCVLNALNATAFPQNPLHTTELTGELESCGASTCCPGGYSCQNNNCIMNGQNSSASTTSSAAPTATATLTTTTTTSSSRPTSTATGASAVAPSQASSTTQCNAFPALAIIAGFFPGLVSGALLTILIIICFGRRRDAKRDSSDFGHIKASVSDPIYHDTGATRTDFLRHGSNSKNTSSPGRNSSRVRSLFSRSSSTRRRTSDEDPGMNMSTLPRTPDNRTGGTRREPSLESIKIYSPPDGRLGGSPRGSGRTTFSTMMAHVGLRQDEPYMGYMGSPGRVDPRSRGVGNGDLR